MSPEQMKRQARRLAEEVWTQGDLAVADELIAHHAVDPSPTPRERNGLAGLKARVSVLRRAFPDLHLIVEDQIVEADRVVTRSSARGTHTGAFLGLAPSDRRVEFELIDVSRVGDDGRIAQHWTALDTYDLLQQLGAPPVDTAA
jgi:steroid delta-isomerase-like uncharacterized protein